MTERHEEKAGPNGEILVTRMGAGPSIVMIHGFSTGRWSWDTVEDDLATEYELFIYDQRGHGNSFKPPHGYQFDDFAGDLDLVLGHFGLERPLIMGHSLGGIVTLRWAISNPDCARALVIEDSPMHMGGEGLGAAFDNWLAMNAMSAEAAAAVYKSGTPDLSDEEALTRGKSITALSPNMLKELRDPMLSHHSESLIGGYRGITSPTLLITGTPDSGGLVPASDAAAFVATLPNATLINIPNTGHNLHRERPREFLQAVRPFLAAHRD